MTKDEALRLALEALESNRRTHHYCEDTWYSCPKHEEGCANDSGGDECNCGADKANAGIDQAIIAIKAALSGEAQTRSVVKDEPVAIKWEKDADKECKYNNWVGTTPFGRILITWKGWKEYHDACVDEFPGDFQFYGLPDEVKAACESEYLRRLYTNPPPVADPHKRPSRSDIKPLTDEEIGAILEGVNAYGTRLYTFARAIEAAHGIKGEA